MQLKTVGLLSIKDRKLLLAYSRNKQCFYLPGGKIDVDETALSSLRREIMEELNIVLEEADLEFYTHISAPAYGEEAGIQMEQDCFLVLRPIEPIPSAEISSLQYFTLQDYLLEPRQAPGAIMILEILKEKGEID